MLSYRRGYEDTTTTGRPPSNILFWRSPQLACERLDCKTVGFSLKISKEIGKAWRKSLTVSPQSCSVFSASFQTFCLAARAYLNTQKYGLFCSPANASLHASLHASTRKLTFRVERSVAGYLPKLQREAALANIVFPQIDQFRNCLVLFLTSPTGETMRKLH